MKQTEPIQQIVDFMNERPEKLFGGKYRSFSTEEDNTISAYFLERHVHPEDGEYFLDEWDFITFHDTRLLRELAKAKAKSVDSIFYMLNYPVQKRERLKAEKRCEEQLLCRWVLIEDEAQLIETIANDILS